MLRAEESAALIAQVLPYGTTSSSTSSPRLLAEIHTKGLFSELRHRNSSLVSLVIVLFITFGLPPLPILIHRPYFLSPLLLGVSVVSPPVSESNFKASFHETLEAMLTKKKSGSVFSRFSLFYEQKP